MPVILQRSLLQQISAMNVRFLLIRCLQDLFRSPGSNKPYGQGAINEKNEPLPGVSIKMLGNRCRYQY